MREIVLIIHNVRSCHNVGSLLRTADGLGIKKVYMTGFTPYPAMENDERLPHIAAKVSRQIAKTSLGAEQSVAWQHVDALSVVLNELRAKGYEIAALEQAQNSLKLNEYQAPAELALIAGNEVNGLDNEALNAADVTLEIPMLGAKESFNVAASAAMALYALRYS